MSEYRASHHIRDSKLNHRKSNTTVTLDEFQFLFATELIHTTVEICKCKAISTWLAATWQHADKSAHIRKRVDLLYLDYKRLSYICLEALYNRIVLALQMCRMCFTLKTHGPIKKEDVLSLFLLDLMFTIYTCVVNK